MNFNSVMIGAENETMLSCLKHFVIAPFIYFCRNIDISRKKQIETESLQKTPEIQELQELRTETSEKDPFI